MSEVDERQALTRGSTPQRSERFFRYQAGRASDAAEAEAGRETR